MKSTTFQQLPEEKMKIYLMQKENQHPIEEESEDIMEETIDYLI